MTGKYRWTGSDSESDDEKGKGKGIKGKSKDTLTEHQHWKGKGKEIGSSGGKSKSTSDGHSGASQPAKEATAKETGTSGGKASRAATARAVLLSLQRGRPVLTGVRQRAKATDPRSAGRLLGWQRVPLTLGTACKRTGCQAK